MTLLIAVATLTLIAVALAVAYLRERRQLRKLRTEVATIEGQSDEELYSKGKLTQLGTLSAGITHEISTPLTVIIGRATRLLRSDPSAIKKDDYERGLLQIRDNAERISKIIQSVREYIYRDESTVEDVISVRELVDRVLDFYGQRLKIHGIELRMTGVDTVYVSGHKGQYEQALLNLISNAFDAVDKLDEKWIEVAAENAGDEVQISVRDSGSGIPADVRARMLDPFYSTKQGRGAGLGLTLVKGIAERHGGSLRYVEDVHTTFVLELPKASSVQYHH